VQVSLRIIFICLLNLIAAIAWSQDLAYTVSVRHTDCNGANNGIAKVNGIDGEPPYSYLWSTGQISNTITGLAAGTYTVTISDSSENDTTVSITIVEIPCVIKPELAFTPNNDGINDTWAIDNIEHYSDPYILIYNRWGQKVYENRGKYEDWDGRDMLGISQPDNSYFYIIYGDKADESSIIKGTVSIIR
jgi:gliding motility-associated-like protein